jgi:hypothetical protein
MKTPAIAGILLILLGILGSAAAHLLAINDKHHHVLELLVEQLGVAVTPVAQADPLAFDQALAAGAHEDGDHLGVSLVAAQPTFHHVAGFIEVVRQHQGIVGFTLVLQPGKGLLDAHVLAIRDPLGQLHRREHLPGLLFGQAILLDFFSDQPGTVLAQAQPIVDLLVLTFITVNEECVLAHRDRGRGDRG